MGDYVLLIWLISQTAQMLIPSWTFNVHPGDPAFTPHDNVMVNQRQLVELML